MSLLPLMLLLLVLLLLLLVLLVLLGLFALRALLCCAMSEPMGAVLCNNTPQKQGLVLEPPRAEVRACS